VCRLLLLGLRGQVGRSKGHGLETLGELGVARSDCNVLEEVLEFLCERDPSEAITKGKNVWGQDATCLVVGWRVGERGDEGGVLAVERLVSNARE
jgi:hypothetical protein